MLASAAAAALAALAVTVAAPAIGDEGAPSADDFAACLREHGLEDAPAGAAIKPWLNERLERGDRTTERAIDACAPHGPSGPPVLVVRELRECLVAHGAQIEGSDPAAVKRWVHEHADDPAARDALKACDVAKPVSPAGSCEPGKAKEPVPPIEKRAPPPKIDT
jgi:hypothetical protein